MDIKIPEGEQGEGLLKRKVPGSHREKEPLQIRRKNYQYIDRRKKPI